MNGNKSIEERLAVVESEVSGIRDDIKEEKESMSAFKIDIYKKLDWIKPAILLLAAIMVLLHPTVADLLGIIKP